MPFVFAFTTCHTTTALPQIFLSTCFRLPTGTRHITQGFCMPPTACTHTTPPGFRISGLLICSFSARAVPTSLGSFPTTFCTPLPFCLPCVRFAFRPHLPCRSLPLLHCHHHTTSFYLLLHSCLCLCTPLPSATCRITHCTACISFLPI